MVQTSISGVFQSDLLIRDALEEGIAELRQNPYLLEYAFAYLPQDSLTSQAYGQKEVDRAKEWFLATEIPIFFTLYTAEVRFPCIALMLGSSNESENVLADVHYDPYEDNQEFWPDLTPSFTPLGYDPFTGLLHLPPFLHAIAFSTAQSMVTKNGHIYPILDVLDDHTIQIMPNANEDFNNVVIRGAKPSMVTPLEGAAFVETYAVMCCVDTIPTHLIYLHTIILFILLRRRQDLLEGRGFERSSLRSQDMSRDDKFIPEGIYSRIIYLSGTVRHFWPKPIAPKLTTIIPQTIVSGVAHLVANRSEAILDAPFVGEKDRDVLDVLKDLSLTKPIII